MALINPSKRVRARYGPVAFLLPILDLGILGIGLVVFVIEVITMWQLVLDGGYYYIWWFGTYGVDATEGDYVGFGFFLFTNLLFTMVMSAFNLLLYHTTKSPLRGHVLHPVYTIVMNFILGSVWAAQAVVLMVLRAVNYTSTAVFSVSLAVAIFWMILCIICYVYALAGVVALVARKRGELEESQTQTNEESPTHVCNNCGHNADAASLRSGFVSKPPSYFVQYDPRPNRYDADSYRFSNATLSDVSEKHRYDEDNVSAIETIEDEPENEAAAELQESSAKQQKH